MEHRPTSQSPRLDSCCHRRAFLTSVGAAGGALLWASRPLQGGDAPTPPPVKKQGARIRVVFIYPPSTTFTDDPDGWWSWPGNEFDAEGRQRMYTSALRRMEKKLGVRLELEEKPVASQADAHRLAAQLESNSPDGLLLVLFYNRSLHLADELLEAAGKASVPTVFFIGLGVKHGSVTSYRRPGVYLIQSLDNLEAIESGLRMIQTKKLLGQSRLLSITEAPEVREGVESFFGITVRVIPFQRYAKEFEGIQIDAAAREWIRGWTAGAKEIRGVSQEALENAARAHFALKKMLTREQADGVTMNCLRRGMLKPCLSFSSLNGSLVPAACENDFPAVYTQLLGQLLTGRPGFQHNPCYETERNHYYASHCTCATSLHGPDSQNLPYLLRRFAHTNEGSCAIQVFWNPGDPVTMVRYHPGDAPALDVYGGKVVASHPMPPAAGCTTNVEIEMTDREDACEVVGHHNLIFCGDLARKFRQFALLHGMRLADTGYRGTWPA